MSVNLQTGFRFCLSAWRMATTKIIAFPWAVYRLSPVCGGLFHLVLLAYLRHAVGESAEEAVLRPACPHAHSMMVLRRNTLLWVILRDLYFPLDTSLRGFSPLQDARCAAVRNLVMSTPISAINDVAARSLMPGWFLVCACSRCDRVFS